MKFRVLIPARHASARLPGKPLIDIGGRPMIARVYERAAAAAPLSVAVATDSEAIERACRALGLAVEMTGATHVSGTDRIAEVARRSGWSDEEIVVNVQGDEPLIPVPVIRQVAALLASAPRAAIATLATPVESLAEYLDPNAVKVVGDATGRALYFSRAPIPWIRDSAPQGLTTQTGWSGALRHVGIYAYRVGALLKLAGLAPTALEQAERLEQLRALENGLTIQFAVAVEKPPGGVDTAADLERVRRLLTS
ncbi:MAG TPA: 3-deoxy-manno-octulosonate cytidylyltransferase [Steroidobacteraceae bacterium]|nr:3-deoxy-manno-octulosonate cytidylyltransferase [Steroidobacteraceae bacterium]